jgi:hypothetical protein
LAWNYEVVHLWRISAEDILAIGRRSLLPLVGLTRFRNPAETVPKVVAEIGREPDEERQIRLFGQLIGLLKDEEIAAMIQDMLPDLDLNELREFPNLWKRYVKMREETLIEGKAEGKAEGERTRAREDILEVIVTRFNPPAADYRRIEIVLEAIDDTARLAGLFTRSLTAADFAEFKAGLSE